jgi:hypothetical protein
VRPLGEQERELMRGLPFDEARFRAFVHAHGDLVAAFQVRHARAADGAGQERAVAHGVVLARHAAGNLEDQSGHGLERPFRHRVQEIHRHPGSFCDGICAH